MPSLKICTISGIRWLPTNLVLQCTAKINGYRFCGRSRTYTICQSYSRRQTRLPISDQTHRQLCEVGWGTTRDGGNKTGDSAASVNGEMASTKFPASRPLSSTSTLKTCKETVVFRTIKWCATLIVTERAFIFLLFDWIFRITFWSLKGGGHLDSIFRSLLFNAWNSPYSLIVRAHIKTPICIYTFHKSSRESTLELQQWVGGGGVFCVVNSWLCLVWNK